MDGSLFGIRLSTTSIIMRKCCEAIKIHLKPLVFKKPIVVWMKQITKGFKALYGILLILGAIDDSHISILAQFHDIVAYYC